MPSEGFGVGCIGSP